MKLEEYHQIYLVAPKLSEEAMMFSRMSTEQRERRVEEDIRNLAKLTSFIPSNFESLKNIMSRRKRSNRESIGDHIEVNFGSNLTDDVNSTESCENTTCSPLMPPTKTPHLHEHEKEHEHEHGKSKEHEEEEEEELPKFETLKPFAFGSKINEAVVLEGLTLSPYAFFSQLAQPEMLNFEILSPRAFIPSVLSPSALIGKKLMPKKNRCLFIFISMFLILDHRK